MTKYVLYLNVGDMPKTAADKYVADTLKLFTTPTESSITYAGKPPFVGPFDQIVVIPVRDEATRLEAFHEPITLGSYGGCSCGGCGTVTPQVTWGEAAIGGVGGSR